MNTKENQELSVLIKQATAGDKAALETVLAGVQDLVFNLSLRMLGTFHDAEDASQDILLKVMTHLSSFKGDSAFTTWVFRIAANHLKDYKKHMFAQFPLSFEFYGDDIRNGKIQDVPDLTQNVEKAILAEELKLSCTNVMLQCLDPERIREGNLPLCQPGQLCNPEPPHCSRPPGLYRRQAQRYHRGGNSGHGGD